jgi:hypothetical protein
MLIGILIAVLVVLAVISLVRWSRRARAGARRAGDDLGELQRSFLGGVMSRAVITSGPLVRLDVLDGGVRLQGTIWSRWLVPAWEARYDELAIAERVTTPFSRTAVWLRLRGSEDGIGFLSSYGEEILRLLEKHDVPVNRSVRQVRRVAELYREP